MKIKKLLPITIMFLLIFAASCANHKTADVPPATRVTTKTLPNEQDVLDAVFNDDTKTLALALEKVPKLANTKTEYGYTALHIAIWKNNARSAKILLGNKADVEAKTQWGFTPLHELTRCEESNDRKEIMEMLIMRRADINALTNAGNTPLDIAEIQDKQDFAKTLKRYGARRVKQNLDLPPLPDFVKRNNEIIE